MTESIWIAVATIIASFISALLAAEWQVRRMRAAANPAQAPPSRLTGIIGRLKYLIKTYSAVAFGMALPLGGILWELSRPGGVDDVSLAFILIYTTVISAEISILLTITILGRLTRQVIDGLRDASKKDG